MKNKDNRYPRVLFITSHAFNHVMGGGVTFSHLFAGWPKDALFTVHNDCTPVTHDVCENYYFLNDGIRYLWPFNAIGKKSRVVAANTKKGFRASVLSFGLVNIRKYVLGNSGIPDYFKPTKSLEECLDRYQPEVIYTILGSNAIMECVQWAKQRYRAKLVVHIMDDWYVDKFKKGIFRWRQRARMQKLFHNLVNFADRCLAICDAMAEEYQKRFHRPFLSFQNAIDVNGWINFCTHIKKEKKEKKEKKHVVYVGSFYSFAQSAAIKDIADAVERIGSACFDVFVPRPLMAYAKQTLKAYQAATVLPAPEEDKNFYEILATADLLVLPSNFDRESIRFIRYSMPTKIPAYMVSQTPILAYGDPSTAQLRYAQKKGWAHCVTKKDRASLARNIENLLKDTVTRGKITKAAMRCALANHDQKNVSRRFQKVLCSIAN